MAEVDWGHCDETESWRRRKKLLIQIGIQQANLLSSLQHRACFHGFGWVYEFRSYGGV